MLNDSRFRVGQDEQKNLIQDFLDKRNMMTLVLYLTPAGVLTADEESPPSSKTKVRTKMRFQTDALKSLCDWLALSDSTFDWLRTPSSKHQFENPP